MTPADHYLEAQRILRGEVGGGITIDTAAEAIALAQVHATLATVSHGCYTAAVETTARREYSVGKRTDQEKIDRSLYSREDSS